MDRSIRLNVLPSIFFSFSFSGLENTSNLVPGDMLCGVSSCIHFKEPWINKVDKDQLVREMDKGKDQRSTTDRKIQQQACFKNINIYFTWYKTDGVWTFCILTLIILIITSYSYNIHSSLLCVHKLCYLLISFFTVYTSCLNVLYILERQNPTYCFVHVLFSDSSNAKCLFCVTSSAPSLYIL